MIQTHLLKLEPPYRILWSAKDWFLCKHYATLIEVKEKQKEGGLHTVSHLVDEYGHVLADSEVDELEIVGEECSTIKWITFYLMITATDSGRLLLDKGFCSIYRAALQLEHYDINVELPGEKDAGGKPWVFEQTLSAGRVKNKETGNDDYWVESGPDFYFGGRYNSAEALKQYLIYMRDEYYRSFPGKQFRLVLKTSDKELQPLFDEVNATDTRKLD